MGRLISLPPVRGLLLNFSLDAVYEPSGPSTTRTSQQNFEELPSVASATGMKSIKTVGTTPGSKTLARKYRVARVTSSLNGVFNAFVYVLTSREINMLLMSVERHHHVCLPIFGRGGTPFDTASLLRVILKPTMKSSTRISPDGEVRSERV